MVDSKPFKPTTFSGTFAPMFVNVWVNKSISCLRKICKQICLKIDRVRSDLSEGEIH